MPETEVYTTLNNIFRDIFLRDDLVLTPDLTAKDVPGWDSFKQIEILIAIEEKYGVKFRAKELDGLNKVGDLVQAIVAKQRT